MSNFPFMNRFNTRHSPGIRRSPPVVLANGSLRVLTSFQGGPSSASKHIGEVAITRKKALLIGIGYPATHGKNLEKSWALPGTYGDVRAMKTWLTQNCGYLDQDIVVLSDDTSYPGHSNLAPTKDNIMKELATFTAESRDGDHYFFLYSGHSGQRPVDKNAVQEKGDIKEEDDKDEYIVPSDAVAIVQEVVDGTMRNRVEIDPNKVILDNQLKKFLVKPLAAKSQLVAVFDSCHSGTLLDLEHHRCNRVNSLYSLVRRLLRSTCEVFLRENQEELVDSTNDPMAKGILAKTSKKLLQKLNSMCTGLCPRITAEGALVVCISACKDAEMTFEAHGSSMTQIMIKVLNSQYRISYKQVMRGIKAKAYGETSDYQAPKAESSVI
ncbi:peptidase C14, caspase domain-containing protein [Crucibulum laeve]|uniref:Peptidase C14, caspase domain-containing protein n=1 Tax=Crucibulum laeve TaxID=68775 RepID=A0A5C3M1U8_9AGAR|nr:peptidase C14, caspase domain-containing protein [Crucibulum laeve]